MSSAELLTSFEGSIEGFQGANLMTMKNFWPLEKMTIIGSFRVMIGIPYMRITRKRWISSKVSRINKCLISRVLVRMLGLKIVSLRTVSDYVSTVGFLASINSSLSSTFH